MIDPWRMVKYELPKPDRGVLSRFLADLATDRFRYAGVRYLGAHGPREHERRVRLLPLRVRGVLAACVLGEERERRKAERAMRRRPRGKGAKMKVRRERAWAIATGELAWSPIYVAFKKIDG